MNVVCQQPEEIDDPDIVDVPVGHGTVLVPVGRTVDWFCAGSGNGLSPPVPSSVDPIGIPTRPTVLREPMAGDEADVVGLDDGVMAVAHVPDAVPAIPVPSNSGVGAEVPDIAPVAEDSPGSELGAPLAELPVPVAVVCIAPMVLEQAEGVVNVIAVEAEELDVIGLTPGVGSSVAPSGTPVTPTGAAAPIPNGDVMPSGGVTTPMPTCANAASTSHHAQTIAATKNPFAVFRALRFFISDLLMAFFLGRGIGRLVSPDRDRDDDIDIAADCIRVRADRMSALDEPFSGLLVDAGNGYRKRGGHHEAFAISTKVDPSDDVDIVIGKAVPAIPAHMKKRVLEAGRISAGEELFGIGRIAPSAKRPGQCEFEVEETVFAADRSVTAPTRRDFCGI